MTGLFQETGKGKEKKKRGETEKKDWDNRQGKTVLLQVQLVDCTCNCTIFRGC